MSFRLRYQGRLLEIGPTPFTIGRNPSCDLVIDSDVLISRKHASFTVTEDRGVIVEDHASRNGVIVNGSRIEKEAKLDLGDSILIGVQQFALVTEKGGRGKNSKRLAATGHHHAVNISDEEVPVPVDYVMIGGLAYAVVPKQEYLRMRKALSVAARNNAAAAAAAATTVVSSSPPSRKRGSMSPASSKKK